MSLFTGENALLEKVERHDRYQFEIKLDYPLDPDQRAQSYSVEAYFFAPQSLNVNEFTYGIREFYSDVRDYVRLKTPQMTLSQIAGTDARSPLARLDECVERFRTGTTRATDLRTVVYEAKMLGCILRAALRDLGKLVVETHGHGRPADRGNAERLADESGAPLATILARFRRALDLLLIPGFPVEVLSALRLVDEYLSLTAESYALHLLDALPGLGPDLRTRVAAVAADEKTYRAACNYRSVAREDSANEEFVYRNSLLKKFVASAQYLQIHREDARTSVEHAVFAVAAGLSMAFATSVTFWAASLAPLSWTLFSVLVISYMLKDRIKEVGRQFFLRLLGRSVADHKVVITDPATGERLGLFRQKFRFMPLADVPPEVRKLRDTGRTEFLAEREFTESVFKYTKILKLSPAKVFGGRERVTALTDVLRMNVHHFLHSLDEPRPAVQMLDDSGHPKQVTAHRTYHLNVVLRFWRGDAVADAAQRKIRVVLDQEGIVRVAPFNPDEHDRRTPLQT